jgi:hypothetical protein
VGLLPVQSVGVTASVQTDAFEDEKERMTWPPVDPRFVAAKDKVATGCEGPGEIGGGDVGELELPAWVTRTERVTAVAPVFARTEKAKAIGLRELFAVTGTTTLACVEAHGMVRIA